jgi:DNA-binding XRE family transcriptional regulator
MAKASMIGSRIRERREMAGLKQADLARRAGISASYLNLIEHNRRRIGGKTSIAWPKNWMCRSRFCRKGREATGHRGLAGGAQSRAGPRARRAPGPAESIVPPR